VRARRIASSSRLSSETSAENLSGARASWDAVAGPSLSGSYAAAPHLLVSVTGDPQGAVDLLLAKRKMSRRVVLTVSNFLQALAMVAESDLVAALPRHFVAKHAARYPVVSFEPPMPLMSSPILAVAPQVATRDGGLLWLLGALEAAAREAKDGRKVR
jgi:DNA-binding transcriptional LysR family regulator